MLALSPILLIHMLFFLLLVPFLKEIFDHELLKGKNFVRVLFDKILQPIRRRALVLSPQTLGPFVIHEELVFPLLDVDKLGENVGDAGLILILFLTDLLFLFSGGIFSFSYSSTPVVVVEVEVFFPAGLNLRVDILHLFL